jgi:hypothetical protein
MFTLGAVVEKFGYDRFQRHKDAVSLAGCLFFFVVIHNSHARVFQARDGMHHVLTRLQKEGHLLVGRLRIPKAHCEPAAAADSPGGVATA